MVEATVVAPRARMGIRGALAADKALTAQGEGFALATSRVPIKSSPSFSNMFRKDAKLAALNHRSLVENIGCNVLDLPAKAQKLILPLERQCAFATGKVVHSSAADLAFDRVVAIQHREFEHHSLLVVT
jgi:hypothetical protein